MTVKPRLARALGALALLCAPALSPAADEPSIHQRYLDERAACAGAAGEDRRTCLREAGAAQQAARRGQLAEGADFEKNRLARCDLHKRADDRDDCLRRMRGEGTVSGSVAGGGILRELVVPVPAKD